MLAPHDRMESGHTNRTPHPAVLAWTQLQQRHQAPLKAPLSIEPLRKKHKEKSAAFRLEGIGPHGGDIVAKRCRRTTAAVERILYETVFPTLPISSVPYFGHVEETDSEFCWLFLEDAGGEEYSPHIDWHRALAARWLGALHRSSLPATLAATLPDRGPAHVVARIISARDRIRASLANPGLSREDSAALEETVSHLSTLEEQWADVTRLCDRFPRTLVHGDFVAKNVRVRGRQAEATLLAFDWETAGWGVPAVDIAQLTRQSPAPGLDDYWREAQPYLHPMDREAVLQLACIGTVFRVVDVIDWRSWRLSHALAAESMNDMRAYGARLRDAIQSAGLRL
jgi:aminoglycoside phosphotransferase (APT) family kinase protein